MKIIGTLSLAIGLFIAGCNSDKTQYSAALFVAVDQTDLLNQYPTAEQLLLPLGLKNSPNMGVIICIQPLTDRDINPQYTFALERQNPLTGNNQVREARVALLIQRVQHCLDSLRPQIPKEHSIIFKPIVDEATALSKVGAEKRCMVVISDLKENGGVSFYDKNTLNELQRVPDQIRKQLEGDSTSKKLTKIDLWFLYRPNSYNDNKPYEIVSNFYKRVFEQYGATVHIDQNFNPQP